MANCNLLGANIWKERNQRCYIKKFIFTADIVATTKFYATSWSFTLCEFWGMPSSYVTGGRWPYILSHLIFWVGCFCLFWGRHCSLLWGNFLFFVFCAFRCIPVVLAMQVTIKKIYFLMRQIEIKCKVASCNFLMENGYKMAVAALVP